MGSAIDNEAEVSELTTVQQEAIQKEVAESQPLVGEAQPLAALIATCASGSPLARKLQVCAWQFHYSVAG